jgi:hypothetical protein
MLEHVLIENTVVNERTIEMSSKKLLNYYKMILGLLISINYQSEQNYDQGKGCSQNELPSITLDNIWS